MRVRTAIGVDVGGTFIKAGVLDENSAPRLHERIETRAELGVDGVIQRMVALVKKLARASRARRPAVGVGMPGPMSRAQGLIYAAPNLPGWINVPLRDRLSDALGWPVNLENDAKSAAYGEFVAGLGRGRRHMVMLTLGTGIGGGLILDGHLHRGFFENAGEIGHMIVEPAGRACPCGQHGCLERYASASAIAATYEEVRRRAGAPALESVSARMVDELASKGDELAKVAWDDACRFLALACVNLQHLFNPELIVLAGGLAEAKGRLLKPVRRHFAQMTWKAAPDQPSIKLAARANDAGWIGAAALARG